MLLFDSHLVKERTPPRLAIPAELQRFFARCDAQIDEPLTKAVIVGETGSIHIAANFPVVAVRDEQAETKVAQDEFCRSFP